ncbi:DUF3275 family protein [Thiolapillus sp.]|uniref:DUF3275 family protein n=1 Tax=Thiolapillus sp. TaxID=2017437 RepID=UPI003AF5F354
MITLQGTLTVRTINGRNGPFNVGRLRTEIGEFSVKDPELDQYEEGRYDGAFGVDQIYPTSYVAGGRMVMEVRARIGLWALDGIDDLKPEDQAPMTEPDPMEETPPVEATPSPTKAPEPETETETDVTAAGDEVTGGSKAKPQAIENKPGTAEDDQLAALFGELWPLGNEVKLDPTVDRSRFREQRDHLKASGYQFRPLDQIWVIQQQDEVTE